MDNKTGIFTSRGEVIGIGKVKVPKAPDFNYEIQMLSFLVIKEKGTEDSYVATCIHLRKDGYGKTAESAMDDMLEEVVYFLHENFTECSEQDAWENLLDLVQSDQQTDELWDAYRTVQIRLSMAGKSMDNIDNLRKRIAQLQSRVEQLESQEARKLEQDLTILKEEMIIDYESLEKVA